MSAPGLIQVSLNAIAAMFCLMYGVCIDPKKKTMECNFYLIILNIS